MASHSDYSMLMSNKDILIQFVKEKQLYEENKTGCCIKNCKCSFLKIFLFVIFIAVQLLDLI